MIDIPDFVYPKDAQGRPLCPRCQKPVENCNCPEQKPPEKKAPKITPKISLDKSGRKGKIVTIISNLPRNEEYLKTLAHKLKTKTGSGGTHYISDEGGTIEIQGDHKKTIAQLI